MEISEIFDKQTMEAIKADAKASGINPEDVEKVLGTLTDQNLAPTRSVNSAPELMSLLDDDQDAVVADVADATGVDRMKTSTILMLAAPFLLKYLFSSGSSASMGTSASSAASSASGTSASSGASVSSGASTGSGASAASSRTASRSFSSASMRSLSRARSSSQAAIPSYKDSRPHRKFSLFFVAS